MADLQSSYVSDEMTKSEIVDFVKENRDEVEQLQDVSISQNKQPLIQEVNTALDNHLDQLAQADGDEVKDLGDVEDDASEDTDDDSGRGQASAPPINR